MIEEIYLTGRICPYCEEPTVFVDSAEIYGTSYGMIFLCRPCKAYVGVHKGSAIALGRLANAELRLWKKNAHACFDPLWKRKIEGGVDKHTARTQTYAWLAEQMNLPRDQTHIGMFDVAECKQVVEICKVELRKTPIQ